MGCNAPTPDYKPSVPAAGRARARTCQPRYQKIAPAVIKLYESGQQSFRKLLYYFHIGSRRTPVQNPTLFRLSDCIPLDWK